MIQVIDYTGQLRKGACTLGDLAVASISSGIARLSYQSFYYVLFYY